MPARIQEIWRDWHADERAWLEELRDGVREEYEEAVQRMVLFGSKVRGDWHTSSDVDVLVIVHDAATAKKREIMRLGAKLAATRKVAPGVMAQTESEWARLGAAMMNIHAEVERQGVSIL